jgi:hypothetical protein
VNRLGRAGNELGRCDLALAFESANNGTGGAGARREHERRNLAGSS